MSAIVRINNRGPFAKGPHHRSHAGRRRRRSDSPPQKEGLAPVTLAVLAD